MKIKSRILNEEIERRKTICFYHRCKECGYKTLTFWKISRKDQYGLIQCSGCKAIEQIDYKEIK